MKKCVIEAYNYYHNPLSKECEKEFRDLPIFFGRKKKEEAIREKYQKQGLKVMRYEDIKSSSMLLELRIESRGDLKACATFEGHGHYVCGIDGSAVDDCEYCYTSKDCRKFQDFLWSDLFD